MSVSERDAGSGFQIAFEGDSATLVGELDYHVNDPGTVLGRVSTCARIVFGDSARDVCSDSGVVPRWNLAVPQNIDEPLRHAFKFARTCRTTIARKLENYRTATLGEETAVHGAGTLVGFPGLGPLVHLRSVENDLELRWTSFA